MCAVGAIHLDPAFALIEILSLRLPPAVSGVATLLVRHLSVSGMALGAFFLIDGIDPEIVLGVLIVVFRRYAVASTRCIARETQIFFVHLKRVSANPHAWSVAVE